MSTNFKKSVLEITAGLQLCQPVLNRRAGELGLGCAQGSHRRRQVVEELLADGDVELPGEWASRIDRSPHAISASWRRLTNSVNNCSARNFM